MFARILAPVALVLVAFVWGVSFVMMKPAIEQQPLMDFLASRFTLATLVMIAVRPRTVVRMRGRLLTRGGLLGLFLGAGYITQTLALSLTTAAITGFLTGLYVVAVPLVAWVVLRQRIVPRVWVGAGLAVVGLGLVSITGFGVDWAQMWGVACAILFGFHMVGLGRWSADFDTYTLTVIQLGVVALMCWVGALFDGYQPPPNGEVWFAVVFTAILATAIAFFVQTWAQARMDASRVAVILTLEVVFAAVTAILVGQETLALKTLIGGALIVAAMVVVEWPGKRPAPIGPFDPLAH